VGTRVRRFQEVRIQSIGDFRGKKLLQLGIAKRDIPTGKDSGATGVRGGQVVYHIGDREKESPESIDIRICDSANPEILIGVTESERSTRTCALELRHIGYRESVNRVVRHHE
jgi:hypothetical protein